MGHSDNMVATYDARVDTTFIGYLLIGFILLMMGVMGLQDGGLFGNYDSAYTDKPIDLHVFATIMGIVGLILILLTIFAYRTGKKESAGIFAFFGASFIFYYASADNFYHTIVSNSNWFMFMAIAIFFLVFAIFAFVEKAPKFVALLLLLVAFVFFFFSLVCFYYLAGPGANLDIWHAMGIVYGIFAFLGFIIAVYLGLAYADPKKIPLI